MRPQLRVRNVLAAAVAVTAAAVALAGAGMPASARPVAAAAPRLAAAAGRPVLLINGDRLIIRPAPDGRSTVLDLPATAGHDSLVSLRIGSRTEEIPADALPYLGHGLDPGLFDLGVLERTETGGRLPVRVAFRGREPVLPGVTITRSGRASAQGYLTASSARAFGAALARQFHADHTRGSYGSGGLFAGGVDIALASASPAPPPRARPDFPMRTLTVTGSNLAGRRDTGDLAFAYNAGNLAAFSDPVENISFFYHGVAKFSVPAGRYWVVGFFLIVSGPDVELRLTFLPEVTVSRGATAHVAERTASSEITAVTPRPAQPLAETFMTQLTDRSGLTMDVEYFNVGGSMWVSPAKLKPAVGTLRTYTSQQLFSPPGAAGSPYVYNLAAAGPAGVIPAQHYLVRPSSLAAVTERYYQDVPSAGAWTLFGGFPPQRFFAVSWPLTLPGLQVQYFSAGPDLLWNSSYAESAPDNGFTSGGQQDDDYGALSAGRHTVDWSRYPLHPQPEVLSAGAGGTPFPLTPSAIRAGNTLTLTQVPFSDNQPGHVSFGSVTGATVTTSYEVDQSGVQIAAGDAANGIPPVTVSKKPSVIRFTLDAGRAGPFYPLSPTSHTVWTWRSRRQRGAIVPPGWVCSPSEPVTRCAVQPMMTLDYHVRGLALNGSVQPGPQLIRLHAGHIQLARAARVTTAAAQVSCDDGATWQQATVTGPGGGNFRIAFSAPGRCEVTLRVSAADAAGSSISETIQRAYQIGS